MAVKQTKKKGAYVTSTPVRSPFADDEGFSKLLTTARYNASQVAKLKKKGAARAEQRRIRGYEESTLIAVREFASSRGMDPAKVVDHIARQLLP